MFSLNKDLADRMIQEYIRCPGNYEFIRIFPSSRSVENSLYEYIKSIQGCEYRIVHVKPTANVSLTDYVLNHRTAGYFIGIMKDKNGGKTHAIGIDISKRVIYDSMGKSILELNNEALNRFC